ncbi:hypothetical protein FBU30_005545 [Linnemannia zychae]|nr:hypothetical protein FBU30_005545 [Linnemannia zychae]
MDVLNREYGPWIIQPPEEEYDFTLQFNIHDLVGNKDPEKVIRNVALLRRNALSGPFERAFAAQAHALTEDNPDFDQSAIEFMRIDCHPDERMYIRHQKQFTQVILGMNLDGFDELSKVFVKLLFEELVHRSRLRSYCTRAPRVIYANLAPPSEVDGREEVIHDHSRCRAYITFCKYSQSDRFYVVCQYHSTIIHSSRQLGTDTNI